MVRSERERRNDLMMKMKEVCVETKLSERAVRLYVKEQLLKPTIVENLHRKEYFFSKEDVAQLKDIAILRNAGFGIADIRHMQNHEEDIPAFIDERKRMLEDEILEQKNIKEALDRLTIGEQTNANKLADALEPAIKHYKKEKVGNKNALRIIYIVGFLFFAGIFMIPVAHEFGIFGLLVIGAAFSIIFAGISIFMGIRYLTVIKRANKLPEKGVGTVLDVIEERGFDVSFARAGTGSKVAGTWGGNGGLWQLVWMFWNEIRIDCWYPMIQYVTDEGEKQLATFPYGWMKDSWKNGEEVAITWKSEEPEIIYPLEGTWFIKKGWTYLVVGMSLVILFGICMIYLYRLFS